ncbi:unnamed protein product, partial [Hydatigera taeniaeformis]|uniref:Zf-C2H2_12 domain-containing protein n=1 Tax=Hydatigena taeniaeformis TaxID=6205 RepID=A0A0R3X7C0_HYDTA
MASHENDFSANRLLFPCLNPSLSSHKSIDSGCCDPESSLNTCPKAFDTFNLINVASQQQQSPFQPQSTPPKRPPLNKPRSTIKKEEVATPMAKTAETPQTGGGASYKYLTWREKDRRRRFREEWKHLWLVVPHGMYEVMCLVCHKIMTQRKLDTIKRHTIRRHAELLSMSESERQRLYHDLVTQYFRRGGDFCGDSDPFCATSVPRLRQTCPRGSRMETAGVRKHPRLTDVPSPPFRARMSVPRRSGIEKHSIACSPPSEQVMNQIKPTAAMPMNLKTFENIFLNGAYSVFTKYLMGFNPTQFPPRGKFDSPMGSLWRRNPLPHTCGISTPHAFQSFKKTPSSSCNSPLRGIPDTYTDPMSCRVPLDMSTSTVPPMQASPSDLSMRRCASTNPDAGTSLTERLMRLVNTWDTAAVSSRSVALLPP